MAIKQHPVIDQDLNNGLDNFANQSFDTVLMTQTLQTLRYPHIALDEMLRIGKQYIVTFPNFGHWRTRGVLALIRSHAGDQATSLSVV